MDRILFISSIFPNQINRSAGPYNVHQVRGLVDDGVAVDVISPISAYLAIKHKCSSTEQLNGSVVYYPRLYHIPGYFRNLNGFFYLAAIYRICSMLHAQHNYKAIFSTWLYPDSWAASVLAKRLQLPLYVKVHGSDVNCLDPRTFTGKKALETVSRAQKTFCVSQALKEKLVELDAAPERLELLYNGIDHACFKLADWSSVCRQLKVSPDRQRILFVGNIKGTKGVFDLLDAFLPLAGDSKYSQVDLVYVGSGGDLEELKGQVSAYGLEQRVSFMAPVAAVGVAMWMNAASLLCLPSHMEGVPNVILEALCCDLPVVATNVGGVPEIAAMDDRISLVELGGSAGLKEALGACLLHPPQSGKRGRFSSWEENVAVLKSFLLQSD